MPALAQPSQALGSCLVLKKSKAHSNESSKRPAIKFQYDLTMTVCYPVSFLDLTPRKSCIAFTLSAPLHPWLCPRATAL